MRRRRSRSARGELAIYVFFFLYFLCATQDIAVDGWAITMLAKENAGWQATCNTVGQNLGIFLSYIGFMVMTSEEMW